MGDVLVFVEAEHPARDVDHRRPGGFRAAAEHSLAAITAYTDGPAEQRSYGDEIIAWTDLAIARASGKQLDLDGAVWVEPADDFGPAGAVEIRYLLRDLSALLQTEQAARSPRPTFAPAR